MSVRDGLMASAKRLTRTRRSARFITRISKILAILAISAGTGGCSVQIQSAHEPMHPLKEPLVISATATGYVGKIDLSIEESQIDASGNETVVSSMQIINTCDPLFWRRSLSCTDVIHGVDGRHEDGRMIKFKATATSPLGKKVSETYQFATGEYPPPDKPIPIRVKGDVLKKFDIVLIRTDEFDLDFFRNYLDNIIEESFFKYSAFREWRMFFNFYYSPHNQSYEDSCMFDGPDQAGIPASPDAVMGSLMADSDVIVYLHEDEMRDCRKKGRFSAEFWFDKSIIHEAGHALFGLRDEYYGGLGPQCVAPRNVWHTESACEAETQADGLESGYCKERGSTSSWKFDQEGQGGCIMNGWRTQWLSDSDFGPACWHRISWHIGECATDECIPDQMCELPGQ